MRQLRALLGRREFQLLLIAGVLIGVYVRFLYLPNEVKIRELEATYNKELRELKVIQNRVLRLRKFRREVDSLQLVLEELYRALPEKPEPNRWIREIVQEAQRYGLLVTSLQPGQPEERGLYTEYPLQLQIRGNYHQLGRFLASLATFPRIIRVSNLSIRNIYTEETPDLTLEATMRVSSFAFTRPKKEAKGS